MLGTHLFHLLVGWVAQSHLAQQWIPRERLSAVDLLVRTSLDRPLFILKILLIFNTKQYFLMKRSTGLNLIFQLVFPSNKRQMTVIQGCLRQGIEIDCAHPTKPGHNERDGYETH